MFANTFVYFYKHATFGRKPLLGPGRLDSVLSVCFKCKSRRERAGKAMFLHVFTQETAGDLRDMPGYSTYA